jgi:hypothetical protein
MKLRQFFLQNSLHLCTRLKWLGSNHRKGEMKQKSSYDMLKRSRIKKLIIRFVSFVSDSKPLGVDIYD